MSEPTKGKQDFKSTDVLIDTRSKKKLKTLPEQENQVIIHCMYTGTSEGMLIRIWPTTFLISRDIPHRSELVLAENIPLYPQWMNVPNGTTINFSLIFTGLPKSCQHFDLVEEIPKPGAFVISNIARNDTDVYTVVIQ